MSVSSALPGWPKTRLIDGNLASPWSSVLHQEHLVGAEWAAVVLSDLTLVDTMRIYPRSNSVEALGYPEDFIIQYAFNGSDAIGPHTCDPDDPWFSSFANWKPLLTISGYPQPLPGPIDFSFAPVEAQCLRLYGTELSQDDYGNRYVQLSEIQVFEGDTQIFIADVAVSSALPGWPQARLIDGNLASPWSSVLHQEHLAGAEWAAVVLSNMTTVNTVRIYPRSNSVEALGYPEDFIIQYAFNGSDAIGPHTCEPDNPWFSSFANWKPLLTISGYPQPLPGPIDFSFAPVEAQCLRIYGTELSQDDYGNRYVQLSEIQVYEGDTQVSIADVAVSSALPGWPQARLIDGNLASPWSSVLHQEHLVGAEWAAVVLSNLVTVDTMRIYPRSNSVEALGYPEDFIIQYAFNGSDTIGFHTCDPDDPWFSSFANWKPLLTISGYPQPLPGPIDFSFAPVEAQCLRIYGTELSQDDYGNRYVQLSEIQVFANSVNLSSISEFIPAISP